MGVLNNEVAPRERQLPEARPTVTKGGTLWTK
jgi:hypothetical protein